MAEILLILKRIFFQVAKFLHKKADIDGKLAQLQTLLNQYRPLFLPNNYLISRSIFIMF